MLFMQKEGQKKGQAALKSLFNRTATVAKVAPVRDSAFTQEAVSPGSVFTCIPTMVSSPMFKHEV